MGWAVEGKDRKAWEQLGELMALQANLARADKKAKVWSGWEFNPFDERNRGGRQPEVAKVPLRLLRGLFDRGRRKKQ